VYMVDIVSDKGVRNMGFNIAHNTDDVLDILSEVFLDYRS